MLRDDICDVLVVSNDAELRGEVAAVVAANARAQTVFADPHAVLTPRARDTVVVFDDEDHGARLDLLQALQGTAGTTAIVYLAARHSLELERCVRQAGVTFYAAKAARGDDLRLALAAILAARTRRERASRRARQQVR